MYDPHALKPPHHHRTGRQGKTRQDEFKRATGPPAIEWAGGACLTAHVVPTACVCVPTANYRDVFRRFGAGASGLTCIAFAEGLKNTHGETILGSRAKRLAYCLTWSEG